MSSTRKTRSRGAAQVEALIALPVFVVLLVGLFFVRDLAAARQNADNEARRCAWMFAFHGCKEGGIPGCEGMFDTSDPVSIPNTDDFRALTSSIRFEANGDPFRKAAESVINRVIQPWVSDALSKNFAANKTIERERPILFGGGRSRVTGKYRLACNVTPPDVNDGNSGNAAYQKVWNAFKSAF